MATKSYHLWNPFTVMDEFLKAKDFGPLTIVRGEGPYVTTHEASSSSTASRPYGIWRSATGGKNSCHSGRMKAEFG